MYLFCYSLSQSQYLDYVDNPAGIRLITRNRDTYTGDRTKTDILIWYANKIVTVNLLLFMYS